MFTEVSGKLASLNFRVEGKLKMETAGITERICRITAQYTLWYHNLPQQATFHDPTYNNNNNNNNTKRQRDVQMPI
jgi:hypothetical protein